MSLYDRLIPAEALRWGRLTDRNAPPWRTRLDDVIAPPIDLVFQQRDEDERRLRQLLDGRAYGESYSRDEGGRPVPPWPGRPQGFDDDELWLWER